MTTMCTHTEVIAGVTDPLENPYLWQENTERPGKKWVTKENIIFLCQNKYL